MSFPTPRFIPKTRPSLINTDRSINIESYWRQAREASNRGELKLALEFSEKVKTEYQKNGDIGGLENCFKFQGNLHFRFNDIKSAIFSYQVLKNLSEQTQNYESKMYAYKQLGSCYKLVKQYHLALVNFKKLLQLAWSENNTEWELKAYDFIGLAYYYLGELEKSKYYHKRMWEGICEDKNSTVRELSLKALMEKRQRRNSTEDRSKHMRIPISRDHLSHFFNLSDDDEAELPSPRTGSGINDHKYLPFYKTLTEKRPKITRKLTLRTTHSNRIRPFMLLSHLSPIESPNNYFYVEQMNTIRVRDVSKKEM